MSKQTSAWTFVGIQALLLAVLVFLPNDIGINIGSNSNVGKALFWLGVLGILASAVTIRKSLTALPLPKEGGQIGVTGLYKFVRHPMYTSVITLSLGISVSSGSIVKYIATLALLILFYYKSVFEEKFLSKKYPDYKSYATKTPRFVPFWPTKS